MFDKIFDAINEWMRNLLTGMVDSNLETMFTDVNEKTSEIATQVGMTPQGWNSSIYSMVQNLSNSVIVPIAGIIITMVLCYELISIQKALDDVNATAFTTDLIAVGNEYLGFNLKIEGLDSPISPEELLEDMLRMGTFGNGSQVDSDASRFTEAAIEGKRSNKLADTFHLIFPSWSQWKGFKPYLVDKPWMLPVEWFKRVGRYLRKIRSISLKAGRLLTDGLSY